ncbi:Pre-mRNA-splicing factor 18 [Symbiodinium microadriaticum]|uniref:Pre-mRNA-splicing factor 18 n=1 Tax=Symbiodinium microadriaticum TaxID=2951 RepID=A0A1Q9CIP5_SYMMI|nr:Pre-mRNA-splicing factor 18 [Symbiodinium microadriaticum]
MADDEVLRNLVASSLWQENRLAAGHSAVWGSFFDSEKRRWGYACCRGTDFGEACALAKEQDAVAKGASSDEEDAQRAEIAREAWQESKLLDEQPPAELSARADYLADEDFLADFVLYWYQSWVKDEKPDAKALQSMREALLKLLQRLRRKAVEKAHLSSLAEFADLAHRREYAQANDVYINITIGKATWHSQLDLGEQRAHWGQGCSLRTMQRQVVEKDTKNAALFDTDPVVQRYVHALKRMVTYLQTVQPSTDPSKQGHVPAPAAKPDEVGLPIRRNIRDGDGRDHSPEFVDVNDCSAREAQRGIAFGQQSNRDHPFTGIGFATNPSESGKQLLEDSPRFAKLTKDVHWGVKKASREPDRAAAESLVSPSPKGADCKEAFVPMVQSLLADPSRFVSMAMLQQLGYFLGALEVAESVPLALLNQYLQANPDAADMGYHCSPRDQYWFLDKAMAASVHVAKFCGLYFANHGWTSKQTSSRL